MEVVNHHHKNFSDPEFLMVRLRSLLISGDFFVMAEDGSIISDTGYADRLDRNIKALHSVKEDAISNIDEPVLIVGGDRNYYHWLMNWLPRYFLAQCCGFISELGVVTNVLSRHQRSAWDGLIGNSPKFVERHSDRVYRVKEGWIPVFFKNPIHRTRFTHRLQSGSSVDELA